MYVQNFGAGDAGPFSVAIYGGCPQEAVSFAPRDVPGLAAGATKFISIKFTFTNTGDCYLGVTVDSGNTVAETNESNNDYQASITSQ